MRLSLALFAGVALNLLLGAAQAAPASSPALHLPDVPGAAHGFPTLTDTKGQKLADGEFTQWIENDRLHVKLTYDFGRGHRIEEDAIFRTSPSLAQERWSWIETKGETTERAFRVDFITGEARAEERGSTGRLGHSKRLNIAPGRTFAGFGFTLAIECLRAGLIAGERYRLRAIGFTPEPRLAKVELSYSGTSRVLMAGRAIEGDEFMAHPIIPFLARPFVHAPDTRIWLIHSPPIGFLRWEGPVVETHDPIVRVDLLPSGSVE